MKKSIFSILVILLAACTKKAVPVKEVQEQTVDTTVAQPARIAVPARVASPVTRDPPVIQLLKERIPNLEEKVVGTHINPYDEMFEIADYEKMPLLRPGLIKDVQASSELSDAQGRYSVGNLIDSTWQSWAEGSTGNGTGESITLFLFNKLTITGFALKNGYGNLDYYGQNNRVKAFKIYADGNYTETIPIKDSISFEQYAFTQPISCEAIQFVIDDVYPGTRYNDTCVAEIALLEWTVDDSNFYENILFWLGDNSAEIDFTQYENNVKGMVSVSDPEKMLLLDYIPFDVSFAKWNFDRNFKTKIALLGGVSSLKLNNNLPRLDGATAMYPLYSSFVHAVYPELKIDETQPRPWDAFFEWVYFPSKDLVIAMTDLCIDKIDSIVQCNTTSTAYERLIDGKTDIIFCYEPSEEERRVATEKGKTLNLTPIARDAFVFIVNEKNNLSNITQQQIRDIYSGRVTNWRAISGVDEPVIAYQRPENSGSQTTLQSIMGRDNLTRPILDGEFTSGGMMAILLKVASNYYNYNSAIGYSFLFYITQMARDSGIKVLTVDGVAPAKQTIQSNAYPFVQTVYAITAGNESENTKRFIEWMLSAQGQELVEKTGYISVNR